VKAYMEDETYKKRVDGIVTTIKILVILAFLSLTCSLAALAISLAVLITRD